MEKLNSLNFFFLGSSILALSEVSISLVSAFLFNAGAGRTLTGSVSSTLLSLLLSSELLEQFSDFSISLSVLPLPVWRRLCRIKEDNYESRHHK